MYLFLVFLEKGRNQIISLLDKRNFTMTLNNNNIIKIELTKEFLEMATGFCNQILLPQ